MNRPETKGPDVSLILPDDKKLFNAYRQAIDTSLISTITDTRGNILYANKKFCEITKYSPAEIIGKNHNIVNSGYHPPDFFKDLWQTIRRGKVWQGEIKNKSKDGKYYWVDTVIVPIKDRNHRISHYLSLRTLITRRKIHEEQQAQYLSSLELLLVMTSANINKPLLNCLELIKRYGNGTPAREEDMREMVKNIRLTAAGLEGIIHELNNFISGIEK
jgi:PAS domain S-box-containing protein